MVTLELVGVADVAAAAERISGSTFRWSGQ